MPKFLRASAWLFVLFIASCAASTPKSGTAVASAKQATATQAPGSAAAATTLNSGTPIASTNQFVGRWTGTVTTLASGRTSPTTVTINNKGRWFAEAFGRRFEGSYTVAAGEAHAKSWTTGATGVWVLRKVNGRQVLDWQFSNSRAELRRAE